MSDPVVWGSPDFDQAAAARFDPDVAAVARLAAELCAVPSVTVPPEATDFAALRRCADIAAGYAERHGLRAYRLEPSAEAPYPFLAVCFGDHPLEDPALRQVVALIGHLDVVPAQQPAQFSPALDGADLVARGAADMKTVVATCLVWMARQQARPGPRPPLALLLSCCEENGSARPHHVESALAWLQRAHGVEVRFAVVGERTGELEWMDPAIQVGPICRENRSWRWLRAESARASGLDALRQIAAAVQRGRQLVHALNESHTPEAKKQLQPGLRSGLVNPFCVVRADPLEGWGADHWVRAERAGGAAVHAAAAQASQPALIELLAEVAARAEAGLGADRVRLAGVQVGEDRNFNTYDGSGHMVLAVQGVSAEALARWAAGVDIPGIALSLGDEAPAPTTRVTCLGLDIRELLDHREAVEALIEELARGLFGGEGVVKVLSTPPWRCPDSHPDLVALAAAYAEVVGQASPDLVKLHGNDGGNMVAYRQRGGAGDRPGEGPVVVFGQVGLRPHGKDERHRLDSVGPYLAVLDAWARRLV